MTLGALAAVPAAPLVLEIAVPAVPTVMLDAVAALRRDVRAAAASLTAADAVVLLASGDEPLVHDATRATLDSYGIPHTVSVSSDEVLLSALAARGQAPRVRADRLDGDLAVLAITVTEAAPAMPVVPVTVPARAGSAALGGVAAGVLGACDAVGNRVAVLAASDLAATLDTTSPGYRVEGAVDWDAAATQAVTSGDVAALGTLGPDGAQRMMARGWAPLTVLLTLAAAAQRTVADVAYHAPRGVGGLVVTSPAR